MSLTKLVSEESSITLDSLKSQGFLIERETFIDTPRVPSDVTSLGEEELMELFTHLTSYLAFINTQLACAEIDELNTKKQLDYEAGLLTLSLTTGSNAEKITVARLKVATDPKIVAIEAEHMKRTSYTKLVSMMYDNVNKDLALISRELTRRTAGDSYKTRKKSFNL
jgi:hypothetical protein